MPSNKCFTSNITCFQFTNVFPFFRRDDKWFHLGVPLRQTGGWRYGVPSALLRKEGHGGEGTKGEALYYKPAARFENAKHRARSDLARSTAAAWPARRPDTGTDALAPRRGRTLHPWPAPVPTSCPELCPRCLHRDPPNQTHANRQETPTLLESRHLEGLRPLRTGGLRTGTNAASSP